MVRSRTALRNAFISLLETETMDAISIRTIAREAGVGSATFYRHYETKTDLLEDIAAQEMKALIDASIVVLWTAGSRGAALALCRYVEEHKTLWSTLFNGGAAGAMRMAFQSHLRQKPAPKLTDMLKSPEDLRLAVSASGLIEVLSWWLRDGAAFDAERVAEFLDELVVGPGSGRSS
jgi:AcrR family transcriptional regulator